MTAKTIRFKQFLSVLLVLCALGIAPLTLVDQAAAGEKVEFRLKDGSRFRGEIGDTVKLTISERGIQRTFEGELIEAGEQYIMVRTMSAGRMVTKTIFNGDIRSIETIDSGAGASAGSGKAQSGQQSDAASGQSAEKASRNQPGVFLLPLRGMVGTYIESNLIDRIGDHADEYGPGQTIILLIDTNGGLVVEEFEIIEKIFELRKRHRVIAWIHKAISAGAGISLACQEIYFMTEGICGSVTTLTGGGQGLQGQALEESIEKLADVARRSGFSPHIARAMKANKEMCSYDKDPETGEVTFYGDLSGEYVLSDANSNLNFNSSNALHCGFSSGTADSEEELARLLDMPRWNERDNYGRKISEDWQDLVERSEDEIPRLMVRYNYEGTGSGDQLVVLGKRLQILKDLLSWWDRCFNCALLQGVPQKEALEYQIRELKHQIAQLRQQRR